MDNNISRFPPPITPGQVQRAQTLPPKAAQPSSPPQAGDQVQLGSAPAPPPVTTKPPTNNGVVAEYTRFQQGLVMRASLPAGHLLPVPLFINAFTDNQGQTTVRAARADNPEQELMAGRGGDGKIYVQLEEGAPLAVFSDNPEDLSYGLAAAAQPGPGGAYLRPLTETVEADGSGRILVNEQVGPVDKQGRQAQTFTEITRDAEGLHAGQVEFEGTAGQAAPKKTGVMGYGGRTEWQRSARDLDGGAIEVKNADAMTHMKNFYKAGWGWNLFSALNGPAPHVLVPFSAMNQADLFPKTMASLPATPPPPPAQPQSPARPPTPPAPPAESVVVELVDEPVVAELVEEQAAAEVAAGPARTEVPEAAPPLASEPVVQEISSPQSAVEQAVAPEPPAPEAVEGPEPEPEASAAVVPATAPATGAPQEVDAEAIQGLLRQQSVAAQAALEEGFAQAGGTEIDRKSIQEYAEQLKPSLKTSAEQMGLAIPEEKLDAMAGSQAMAFWADARYAELGGDNAQDTGVVQGLAQVYQADQAFLAAETQLVQLELALAAQEKA